LPELNPEAPTETSLVFVTGYSTQQWQSAYQAAKFAGGEWKDSEGYSLRGLIVTHWTPMPIIDRSMRIVIGHAGAQIEQTQ
jgi:hypothetical protein